MATDEASLAAALMRGEPVTLERGTVVRLTRTLLVCEDVDAFFTEHSYMGWKKEDYHCECRRLRPRREGQSVRGACAAGGRREG